MNGMPRQSPPTAAPVPAAGVSLHIERLVLTGLPLGGDAGARLHTALRAELGRALGDARTGLRGEALAVVRLPDLALDAARSPEQWGRQLAQALVQGLAPTRSSGHG